MSDDTMFSYTLEIKDGDKSGLITARGNDKKEFTDNLAVLDDIIEKRGLVAKPAKTYGNAGSSYTKPTPVTSPANQSTDDETKPCPIHNVTMYRKEGKYGTYYSHGNKESGYCNGKPKVKSY